MVVKVLGPLDTGAEPLSPRERALLSALIVRVGSTVASAELADAWWGDEPPRTWEQQVRNSIARIRSRLGRSAVETVGVEYRLGLDPDAIDAVRFERLVSTARAHRLRGEHDRAADAYGRALGLWRGAPLQDVANWEPGIVEAMRLNEIRASAEEELLDARLAAGEHRSLIADAERLLREEPLREDRWSILALANYRADRQAEALALLRAARERLADELGIEPGPRLAALELAMLRRDPELEIPITAMTSDAPCPYPGLRAFGPDDADVFFGRDADTEAVLERIARGAVVTIAGASGTGKSSLLLAGVLPRLRARGRSVEVLRPGAAGISAVRRAVERSDILAVDQAEELLDASADDLDAFTGIARGFLDGGGAVVLTLRSDALDRTRAIPHLGDDIGRGVYLLGPLSDAAYRSAIEAPARAAGLRIEPGLVELAVRDAGDRSSTLPHLSHAMQETWNRREGMTLTVEGYRHSGGIPGAIAQSAEDAFRALSSDDQGVCRSLMMRLIERTADGTSTRRRVPAAPLLADASRRHVLERLTRARLVTVDGDAATVAHEAVATAWPRLDAWLEEDAEGARTMRAVESVAEAWESGGRYDDDLLRGARLHSALAWRDAAHPDLTDVENDLLTASIDREQREVSELGARAIRDRRRNRVLGVSLVGAGVLLVAAIVAGSLALVRGREAAASAEDARIEALVATSLALHDSDRDLATLLAVETYLRWPDDPRVRSALLGNVLDTDGVISTHAMKGARDVYFATLPGTDELLRVVEASEGPRLDRVDATGADVVRAYDVELPEDSIRFGRSITVSADGRIAAIQTPQRTGRADRDVCCWNDVTLIDLESGELLAGTQLLRMRTTYDLALDRAGDTLFLGQSVTGDIMSVDTGTGEVRASSPAAFDDYTDVPSSYDSIRLIDDDRVAIGSEIGVQVYDAETLRPIASIPVVSDQPIHDFLSVDGGIVVAHDASLSRISTDGSVRWTRDLTSADACWNLTALSPRGSVLCSGLGVVGEFGLDTGEAVGELLRTQYDGVASVTPHADGEGAILANGELARWMSWRLTGEGPATTRIASGRALVDGVTSNGLIVTVPIDGGGDQLWDVAADEPVGVEGGWFTPMGGDVVLRWEEDGISLENTSDGSARPVSPELDSEEIGWIVLGRPGPHGFAITVDAVIPFDPSTGEVAGEPILLDRDEAGKPIRYDDRPLHARMLSVSETSDGEQVVLTWFTASTEQTMTAVADRQSGRIIVERPMAIESTAVTSEGDIVAVGDDLVQRLDIETLEPTASFPKAAGGSDSITVTDDAQTLMNRGWDQALTLYDLPAGLRLAAPIPSTSGAELPGGFLSPDGAFLVTNGARGVLRLDMAPSVQAEAACGLTPRDLTELEWRTYFPGEPWRSTCAALG